MPTRAHKMMYHCLIAYMSITNEIIFKNFVLSDCRKAKLLLTMLVVVSRRLFHVEPTADEKWRNSHITNILQYTQNSYSLKNIQTSAFCITSKMLTGKVRRFVLMPSKTAFTPCRHISKKVKNSSDRPPVHTKQGHFLPAAFENGRF